MRTIFRIFPLVAAAAISAFAQTPTITAVDNGFSFTNQISPGVLATIFGTNLTGNNLVVTLDGIDCPVTYSSANQINIQVPWEATVGAGKVGVTHDGLASARFPITVSKYSPALISLNGSGSGTGEFFSGSKLISMTNPANAGDTLTTYAVGLGATSPAIATGTVTPNPPPLYVTLAAPVIAVSKREASVLFSGLAPGALATDQLNFTLAAGTPVGTDTVALTIGGVSTGLVNIPIACLDVTAEVSVSLGTLEHTGAGTYLQKVTITNTSGKALPTNASVVLTSLTAAASLTNGGGSLCPSSDGSPYKTFAFTGTGSAQSATVSLKFSDTTSGAITYGQRILVK